MRGLFYKYLILILVLFMMNNCVSRNPAKPTGEKVNDLLVSDRMELTSKKNYIYSHGAVIRGDTTIKEIALIFSGDEFGDGGDYISEVLYNEKIKASFFLTGNFYRKTKFRSVIKTLINDGHFMGSHSDKHPLYCDWINRDSLLLSKCEFMADMEASYIELENYGIKRTDAHFFLPPYEWFNDTIASWTAEMGLQLINFSPGSRSNADYTYPELNDQYMDSRTIYNSIIVYDDKTGAGLNGYILLIHLGTDPRRTDKFYFYLPELINELKNRGYRFVRIDELLK
jgi:endoglucanase